MTEREALIKIATVNAMDYEYQAWAREALAQLDENYKRGYADAMNWKVQNHLEHLPSKEQAPMNYYKADAKGNLERTDIHSSQPEQEPVAWVDLELWTNDETWPDDCFSHLHVQGWTPLYTTPPQRKPLTLDGLWRVFTRSGLSQFHQRDSVVEYKYQKCIEEFARAIEAAHGIKGEA